MNPAPPVISADRFKRADPGMLKVEVLGHGLFCFCRVAEEALDHVKHSQECPWPLRYFPRKSSLTANPIL
jgi:hypothetical protein